MTDTLLDGAPTGPLEKVGHKPLTPLFIDPTQPSELLPWHDLLAELEAEPEYAVDTSGECKHPKEFCMICKTCGHPIRIKVGCGSRFDRICPHCATKWRRKTRSRYMAGITYMKRPKLVTLTLKKYIRGWDDSGKAIYGCKLSRLLGLWKMRKWLFKTLHRRGYQIGSWCGVVEPPNHIHMVVDMDYVPQHELSEIWQRITGDSFIVDIRAIKSIQNQLKQVSAYLAKYITKASHHDGINLDWLKGFHLIGSWRLEGRPARYVIQCPGCWTIPKWYRVNRDDYEAELYYLRSQGG